MGRSLRTCASLLLLFVLTSAPLATLVCAEWCAPSRNAAGALVHRQVQPGGHAASTAMPSTITDCHRGAGNGPAVTAHPAPECPDFALSSNDAGPVAPRLQVAAPMSHAADILTNSPHPMLQHVGLATDVVHYPPSRPLAASPVLRI